VRSAAVAICGLALNASVLAAPHVAAASSDLPGAAPCPPGLIAELTAPAEATTPPFRLTCSAVLAPGARIQRHILIEGEASSGVVLDCNGGSVGRLDRPVTTRDPTIAIWSASTPDGFSRPTDVTIRNCIIHGAVRIWGMGAGGSMSDLRPSSRTPGHTAAAQAAAPSRIVLHGSTLVGSGSIPLYVGPGATQVSLVNSHVLGRSVSTAVYLDAESARNRIENVVFDIQTRREQIAVDGSARNHIVGNRFDLGGRGGIFLYRNCGEDGVIRHQTPSDNVVTDNVFHGAALLRPRTVVVGAREGGRRYCADDAGWPFGSSADDGDNATGNVVARNRIVR
jgi:hypothetical protein